MPSSSPASRPPSHELLPDDHWDLVIRQKDEWLDLQLGDVWRYRDLLWMFVWRDFVAVYKQTVLGPLWFVIQPLLTTIVFTIVFTGIAQIPTDGMPPMLFYLAGTTAWNYFAACLTKTSNTFTTNASIFGKVYFPRIITPFSVVLSNVIQFAIQYLLFVGFLIYYGFAGSGVSPDWVGIVTLTPLLLAIMGLLGLGCGIVISSLTTKYRDFQFLVTFGVQLLMYATPVIYSTQTVPEKYRFLVMANPMTPIIECFRSIYLGSGTWSLVSLSYSIGFTLVLLIVGILVFRRVEKSFMDTV